MKVCSIIFLFFFSTVTLADPRIQDLYEEVLYQDYQKIILAETDNISTDPGFTLQDQSLFIDALWDLVEEGHGRAQAKLKTLDAFSYTLVNQLRIALLKIRNNNAQRLPEALVQEIRNVLLFPAPEMSLIYNLAAYQDELRRAGHDELISLGQGHPSYFDVSNEVDPIKLPRDMVYDLFHHTPDVTTYMNGEYFQSVKLFMFCRPNRLYPCLLTMRDVYGEAVRNEDGSLWTQKALGSSARGLPSYIRNGNTPAGVFTMDSVMPYADQQISYGKFRRIILNFVPPSKEEVLTKSLLPLSSHASEWWKPASVARDIGRNLFRIHGTGRINRDTEASYYPFMRTNGCIAQRENTYGDMTYTDQQDLLNQIMLSMDLEVSFENEVKVKGILYLMEIDDLNAPVTSDDLAIYGIE